MHFYDNVRVPGVKVVIAGHGRVAMPPSLAFLTNRQTAPDTVTPRGTLPIVLIALLNLAALGLMVWSEAGFVPKVVFCLTWGLLNFFWLAVLRRPVMAATLSLSMIVVLILVSRLKYDIIWMTANFLDVLIVNADTILSAVDAAGPAHRRSPRARLDRCPRWRCFGGSTIFACGCVPQQPDLSCASSASSAWPGVLRAGMGSVLRRQLCVQILPLGRAATLSDAGDPRLHGFRGSRSPIA